MTASALQMVAAVQVQTRCNCTAAQMVQQCNNPIGVALVRRAEKLDFLIKPGLLIFANCAGLGSVADCVFRGALAGVKLLA